MTDTFDGRIESEQLRARYREFPIHLTVLEELEPSGPSMQRTECLENYRYEDYIF